MRLSNFRFWLIGGPTGIWTITGSKANAGTTDDVLAMVSTESFIPVNGHRYKIEFAIASYAGGSVAPVFGSTVAGAHVDGVGVYEYTVIASAGTSSKVHGLQASALTADVDDYQIRDAEDQTYQYTYSYQGLDISAYAVVFNLDYRERRFTGLVLSDEDQSIPAQQKIDRVYANP